MIGGLEIYCNIVMKKVRKWSEKDIRIKLKNLKKIINPIFIEGEILFQQKYTSNLVDAMNLAFYSLKQRYSKISASKYGWINTIDYEPKPIKVQQNTPHWFETQNSYTIDGFNDWYNTVNNYQIVSSLTSVINYY